MVAMLFIPSSGWRRLSNVDARRLIPEAERWNHNIHSFDLVFGAVPTGPRNALDVGCGDGMLARRLAQAVERVVGARRGRSVCSDADLHPPTPRRSPSNSGTLLGIEPLPGRVGG